jgi:hypothetical protein
MKQETLQARLARSLDAANRRETRTATAPGRATRKTPATPAAGRQGAKLSVSLFASDLARLEAIRAYMAERGARVSTSQAVKLALRTAPLSGDV